MNAMEFLTKATQIQASDIFIVSGRPLSYKKRSMHSQTGGTLPGSLIAATMISRSQYPDFPDFA